MLRKTLPFVLILIFSCSLFAEKVTSFSEAKALAESSNKPLLIDFMTDWWGSCKVFAREAKEDEDVIKKLEDVVLIQVNCEQGEGIELAKKYGIKGYPTFVLANSNADTYYRWMGYSKELFFEKMAKGFADLTTIDEKVKRYNKKPDAATASTLAEYEQSKGNVKEALVYYKKAAALDDENDFAYPISGRKDLDDMGLIHIRHGEPDIVRDYNVGIGTTNFSWIEI